jgi:hypothetical protein
VGEVWEALLQVVVPLPEITAPQVEVVALLPVVEHHRATTQIQPAR